MAAQDYEVRVSVTLRPDTDRSKAFDGFGKLFRMDAGQVASVFAAGTDCIKRNLDEATARKLQHALLRLGIDSEVRRMAETPAADSSPGGNAASATLAMADAAAPAATPPVPPAPAQADATPGDTRALPLKFHGREGEFFRIWIVNLALSIVTLGIYSAWAKVRERQYLYGNTELDGHRFSYLAKPLTILKGRLVALALLAVYVLLGEIEPAAQAVTALILIVFLPLLLVRAMRFNLRMSAYRHVRFGFDGTVGGAYGVFIGWPLLAALTLWILLPLMICKQQSYLANGMRYGTQGFDAQLTAKPFYSIYLRALLFGTVGGTAIAVLSAITPFVLILFMPLYIFLFGFVSVNQTNLVRNAMHIGPHHVVSSLQIGSWLKLQLVNMLAVIVSLGLLIPWAKIRVLRYNAEHFTLMAQGDLDVGV